MLTQDQARELVVSQLALDFRDRNPGELIQGEIERDWGWLFLYPDFGGGPGRGWLVNRQNGEMKHLPEVVTTEDALAEYEGTLGRRVHATLAIETRQLTRFYNDFCAVSGVDLAVERGTFYGFLGPNGAGKSTTIKMLTGLLAPSGGQMIVLGRNMLVAREALEAKRHVGVIPEDLALLDNLTAREYLTFVGRIHLMPRETIRGRCDELLSLLGLQDEEKKLTLEYSHGMKKKLAMAAALLPNPDLLFLDEPFEGVDAVTSRVIRDLLSGFVARGSTVFLTSHVLEIVERLCTHVGIIVKGRLVEQASLETIRRGGSLEDRFMQQAGADPEATRKLNWLEEAAS